jgi:lipid-A-disaccharide synthase-like uncharacterized protein
MPDPNGFLQQFLGEQLQWLYRESIYWTAVGLFGNGLFSSRFLIQWLQSERQKRLVVPAVFWHLSFWGSLVSLIYAFHVDKLPVILGYLFLPFIYARNLKLLRNTAGPPHDKV